MKIENQLKKERRREFGEKKAQMQQIERKYDEESSDSDIMEDPESEEDKVE